MQLDSNFSISGDLVKALVHWFVRGRCRHLLRHVVVTTGRSAALRYPFLPKGAPLLLYHPACIVFLFCTFCSKELPTCPNHLLVCPITSSRAILLQ